MNTLHKSLAMLALASIFVPPFFPSTAFSSATSVGSLGSLYGNMPSPLVASQNASPSGSLGNSNVVPPQANLGGKSYAEWSAAWWRWTMSHPFSQFDDPNGQFFPVDQTGTVWFLTGSLGPNERSCTLPADKYLVCPLFLYLNDYPCPDTSFHPAPGQTMEDFLSAGAKAIVDGITPPSFEVDGVALQNLSSYRATSRLFTFTGDLSMQAFDGCVTGSEQVGVSDGYLVILKPLRPGPHTLRFSGFGDVIVHLTVSQGK